mmetsp:Transcript_20938/g.58606  ORF Transcript_20938/g.58606 Transcript_20938/m.58606 type:complete len:307 (-) Transcript_20938:1348-2268(-)
MASDGWTLSLRLSCHCGACTAEVRVLQGSHPVRCFCTHCRHFHAAAFASLLPVVPDGRLALGLGAASSVNYSCGALGRVQRYFCARCYSNLATFALGTAHATSNTFLNMGALEDGDVAPEIAMGWARRFEAWAESERPRWLTARPWPSVEMGGRFSRPPLPPDGRVAALTGRCACGGCAYQADCGEEFQLQHCYCRLCRKMSGSAFQTWIPVRHDKFRWLPSSRVRLIRTTPHGQRHVCSECGGILTIIYDSQPSAVWIAAGMVDDVTWPADLGSALRRTIHICCSFMPVWYVLPEDGMPRIPSAG